MGVHKEMRSYTLEVDGVPKAQVRHRHKRFGGVYDPSAKDKMLFKARLVDQWDNEPLTGSISIKLRFKMPYRKSDFRTGKFAGELKPNAPTVHTVKPDIDNLEKFVLDALNGKNV